MRKFICIFLTILFVFSCTTTASASDKTIDVYAKFERNVIGEYISKVENSSAKTIIDENTTITITNAPKNAAMLVVIPMTDNSAKNWVSNCLKDQNLISAYDIHFQDANGNRINADGTTIKIDIIEHTRDLTVSSVSTASVSTKLNAQIEKDSLTFTANGSHYYAISQKKQTLTVPVIGDKNKVDADVTIDGDTVKIEDLDSNKIDYIIGERGKKGIMRIDLTGLDNKVNKIIIPVNTIQNVVQTPDYNHEGKVEHLQINFNIGSVKLDDKAMKAVVEKAEGEEVVLVLESVGTDKLTDKQKESIDDKKVYGGFETYLQCTTSKKLISDFEQGTTTFSVPFIIPDGMKESDFSVFNISDDGESKKANSWYEDGKLCWDATVLSNFIVVSDTEKQPDSEEKPHSIIIKDNVGGKVELDPIKPTANQVVTITPIPDNDKAVDKVTITDKNGNELEVTDNGDGTYSFNQPDTDVTIDVTFKDKQFTDNPYTGITSHLQIYILTLLTTLFLICLVKRKKKGNEN